MSTIAVLVSPSSYLAGIGTMIDAYTRLGDLFLTNASLRNYAKIQTELMVAGVTGRCDLASGRTLPVDAPFTALRDVRIAYLPSFQLLDPAEIDELLKRCAPFHAWLGQVADSGAAIGASGASVFHLAAAGLLDRQACVVPPKLEAAFRARFPKITVEKVSSISVSGRLFACSRDIDTARLVNRLFAASFSPELAQSLALREPIGEQEDATGIPVDPLVMRAQAWIRDHFARDFRIADLAEDLGVSHQVLIRRFRLAGAETPRNFVQGMRVRTACIILTETRRSVSEIAQLVGYRNVPSFREVFASVMGMSPGAYRQRHRRAALPGHSSVVRP